jgi:hypothetical protein
MLIFTFSFLYFEITRLANETNQRILLLEGGAKGTGILIIKIWKTKLKQFLGQRDIGGIDYVASDFKSDPITSMIN